MIKDLAWEIIELILRETLYLLNFNQESPNGYLFNEKLLETSVHLPAKIKLQTGSLLASDTCVKRMIVLTIS